MLVLDPVLGGACARYYSTGAINHGGSRPEKLLASIAGILGGSSNGRRLAMVSPMGGISCSAFVSMFRETL